ncbi:MAG: hypothetical protein JWO06_86 [Bacteroidota bacterium]|nr:hypothetical protein [Bacteroidota bacterium]
MNQKIKCTTFLLLIFVFASAQKDDIKLSSLNFGREGYFNTYEDFVKGKVVEGAYKGSHHIGRKYFARFKVNGKTEKLNTKAIWGFWSKADGLIRINHKDDVGYKLISVGDVYYYCPWFIFPRQDLNTGKIEYMGIALPHEMISVNLNSEMIGAADLFYEGVKRATEVIAGNADIYKFELCGHGAYENIPKRKLWDRSAGWEIGSCYKVKSNPRIWLNPGIGSKQVVYIEETVEKPSR